MMSPDIYSYIKTEEARFETDEIKVADNWSWNLRNHVQLLFHLKNSQFYKGENNFLRAFKNIMEPMLNLADWMEDIEMKDIVFFIENRMGRVLSFLVKKYHDEVYSRENDLDKMIDEITESDNAYGGVLLQRADKGRPEVLKLTQIAFCDQTDVLGGPIAFKHHFSPSKLRQMSKLGWGDSKYGADISIEDLIVLATTEKENAGNNGKKNQTTGKVIEIYLLKGDFPEHYLKDNDNMEDYSYQLQIRAFYTNKEGKKEGVCLYRMKEDSECLKFHTSKEVDGRGLGRGIGEMVLHPQIWTNFLTIHKMNFLEAASKVPLYTDDPNYKDKNKIQDMETLEITTIEENKRIYQVPTASPVNLQLISGAIDEWFQHSQLVSSAFDPVLGKEQSSGTTFRGQERVVHQGEGFHKKRRGQRCKLVEFVYRDWILPDMVKEIVKGKEFLAELSTDELSWVTEQLAENYASHEQNEDVLNGELPRDKETLKQEFLKDFSKKGNKHLLKILKDEFRDVEIKMGINVGGKQKDLAMMSDKLLSIIQFAFSNPEGFKQTMQIPGMAKSFNDIMEFGGLNPVDFSTIASLPSPIQPQQSELQAPVAA